MTPVRSVWFTWPTEKEAQVLFNSETINIFVICVPEGINYCLCQEKKKRNAANGQHHGPFQLNLCKSNLFWPTTVLERGGKMVKTSCYGKKVLIWALLWIYIKLSLQSICEYLSGHFCWGIKGGEMRCLTHHWLFCLWLQKLVCFNYVNLICQLGLAWIFNLSKLHSTTSPPKLHFFH